MANTVDIAENGWITITDEEDANEIQIRPLDEGILLGINGCHSLLPLSMLADLVAQLTTLES